LSIEVFLSQSQRALQAQFYSQISQHLLDRDVSLLMMFLKLPFAFRCEGGGSDGCSNELQFLPL